MITIKVDKVNRFLARYSPRARKQKFSYPQNKKQLSPLFALYFGRAGDQINIWPKMPILDIFGPKIHFWGEGSETFGTLNFGPWSTQLGGTVRAIKK